jgi:hypothetical protein
MRTESTGFEPEPMFPLAEQAENQVLRERLYAAQNTVARLENERDGKVLVDPQDLRAVLRMACDCPQAMPVSPEEDAVLLRLEQAARAATEAGVQ